MEREIKCITFYFSLLLSRSRIGNHILRFYFYYQPFTNLFFYTMGRIHYATKYITSSLFLSIFLLFFIFYYGKNKQPNNIIFLPTFFSFFFNYYEENIQPNNYFLFLYYHTFTFCFMVCYFLRSRICSRI